MTETTPRNEIPLRPIESRLLSAYGYDVDRELFAAQFKSTGTIYHYRVSTDVFEAFLAHDSKGAFFLRAIKSTSYVAKFEPDQAAPAAEETAS